MAALPTAPLLAWPEIGEAARLREERADLMRRAKALKPYAHRRLVLEARLASVTAQLLEVEARLEAGAARHGVKL